jgi:hypothetical protein
MPIVFVHGVNVRSTADFGGIASHLRETVAPVLARKSGRSSGDVDIRCCYWGDLGVSFAWNMASLPANSSAGLASMGSSGADLADKMLPLAGSLSSVGVGEILARQPSNLTATDPGIIAQGPWQAPTSFFNADADGVAGLLITMLTSQDSNIDVGAGTIESLPTDVAEASMALDKAAREIIPSVLPEELASTTLTRISARAKELAAMKASTPGVVGMGPGILSGLIDRATFAVDALIREANDATGDAVAHTLIGIRHPLNQLLTRFLGDIFVYLNSRDQTPNTPSPILMRVMRALLDAHNGASGEPLVVLTHSMGGQILYDLVTWYLERTPGFEQVKIDVWGAAACQVGIFEEMKLFKKSDAATKAPERVSAPASGRLGRWFGYWDPSDVLSFLTSPVIDGCADRVFTSGTTPLQAHGQYLVQPRFYRMLANDVAAALP